MEKKCKDCRYGNDPVCKAFSRKECVNRSAWEPKTKEDANGWHRLEDEMPEKGREVRVKLELEYDGKFTKEELENISYKRGKYWQYDTVPAPPVDKVKNSAHIDHMTSFPGGDATPELIDNNFSQLYRKINELVDAVNRLREERK